MDEYRDVIGEPISDKINQLAADGWRVVAANVQWALLKREKPEERQELAPKKPKREIKFTW